MSFQGHDGSPQAVAKLQDGGIGFPNSYTSSFDRMYSMVYDYRVSKVVRTDEFAKWLKRLRDSRAKARINLRVRRIMLTASLGDFKYVADGVCELRIDYGPGYRLYFAWRSDEVVLLLIGGDKSTQRRDVQRAIEINRRYE